MEEDEEIRTVKEPGETKSKPSKFHKLFDTIV